MIVRIPIKIPDWLYRFRWENVKNYVTYQLHPFRCESCKKKLPFRFYDLWVDAKYPLKHKLGISYDKTICPECMAKELERTVSSVNFVKNHLEDEFNVSNKCDVCENETMAFKYIRMSNEKNNNMRFCVDSWNSGHVCLDCIRIGIRFGEMDGGRSAWHNGKGFKINTLGLPVINGKVRFPK